MTNVRSSFSHGKHVLNSRVQRSMEGWSVIEKITEFTHAVCRVADGRGSAILVALPHNNIINQQTTQQQSNQNQQQSPLILTTEGINTGVLLTTSFVFPNREEAQGANVKFLEQPVAGTQARQGRRVEIITAELRVDKVFVCSTSRAPPRQQGREHRQSFIFNNNNNNMTASSLASSSSLRLLSPPSIGYNAFKTENNNNNNSNNIENFSFNKNTEYPSYSYQRVHENKDPYYDEEEEELGYTLTLCDINLNDSAITTTGGPQIISPSTSLISRGPTSFTPSETSFAPAAAAPIGQTSIASLPPLRNPFISSLGDRTETSHVTFPTPPSDKGVFSARTTSHLQHNDIFPIKPLPLPLLLSNIAPIQVGDHHLMITHINGLERHYVVQKVKNVGEDSCEYEFCDPGSEFSSGGPIFDMKGDFVGLQHQNGDHSYGIFISSIVRHLFQSTVLGLCRIPIVDSLSEFEDAFDTRVAVPEDVFNQPFHINQKYHVLNVGAGDQLIEYEEFKRLRLRNDIQDSIQPPSLIAPWCMLVWKEFYTDFTSLVLILHAFSHSSQLAKLALKEMTSHEHRKNLPHLASLGGIGITLEIIDAYPQSEEIVLAGLTVLARSSLYKRNREAIYRCDGVLSILEIMNEYSHNASIQHWGFCCLQNVMAYDSPIRTEAISLFTRIQGIALAIEALRVHHNERHVLRHTSLALSCVACEDARYAQTMIYGNILNIIMKRMKENSEDSFVFFGLASLLRELIKYTIKKEEVINDEEEEEKEKEEIPTNDTNLSSMHFSIKNKFEISAIRSISDESNNFNMEIIRIIFDNLVEGKVLTVLGTVMANESLNTYSSEAVTLLNICISSVLVLLHCPAVDIREEVIDVDLIQTCERIINNFPTEKILQEQARKIAHMLSKTN